MRWHWGIVEDETGDKVGPGFDYLCMRYGVYEIPFSKL